ncbi:MAG TPA: hypothetical protein ENK14_08120 [Caldithrix sp.]|nr:hypothetical protein [Caldithrix sp.]
MRNKKLIKEHRRVILALDEWIRKVQFYLAGGTALFYYYNHRRSIDLDFFTSNPILLRQHLHFFKKHQIVAIEEGTLHAIVHNVKVSFFSYPYRLLKPFQTLENLSVAHPEDILCMKINAIVNRGCKKDFVDTYVLMRELALSSKQVIELFQEKYGSFNPLIIHKELTYFADADTEPELDMIDPIDWEEVKKFFVKTFSQFNLKKLNT